ncbi:MAG: hypothetical protein F6K24_31395 [Okeania sp. SIO2D1]|nr:hypothetical protein [Okeania sp. SIO2D1]
MMLELREEEKKNRVKAMIRTNPGITAEEVRSALDLENDLEEKVALDEVRQMMLELREEEKKNND